MSERWSAPKVWPPGTRISKAGDFALLGDDVVEKPCPFPVLEVELDFLDRPSASKVLPVHPFGAQRLFEHSRAAAHRLLDRKDLTKDEGRLLMGMVWKKCRACYCPGEPVRASFDRLTERTAAPPPPTGKPTDDDLLGLRLEYLAVVCVAQGLSTWAAPGGSDVPA